MMWKPNVTVAAIIENQGQFLLVEEETESGILFNQPAGHLERGESLLQAVSRETLEETAYHFQPEALVGVYLVPHASKPITYLRFAFAGRLTGHEPERALDKGILQALWMDLPSIQQVAFKHRSPLVLRCIEDYLAGHRFPLTLLTAYL